MRISTSQMAQMVMQSLQSGANVDGKLELKIGSIVRATLLDFLGNKEALIQIGATKLRAQLDTNLQAGDKVALLVTGETRNGALELKVVSQEPANGQTKQTLDPSAILRAVGLPDGDDARALVREFLARGLPLKPDTFRAAHDLLRQLPNKSTEQVVTLGKMAEIGVPLTQSTFDAMHTLDTGPKLHDLLAKVCAAIEELPEPMTTTAKGDGASKTTEGRAHEQQSPGNANARVGDSATGNSNRSAANVPTEAQLHFPENKISRLATASADTMGQPRESLSITTRGQLEHLGKVAQQLLVDAELSTHNLSEQVRKMGLGFEEKLAHAIRRLPPDSSPSQLQAALEAVVQQDPETGQSLKQALLQLQATRQELEAAGLHQLADDVGILLKHVTGQQLMQAPGHERSDLFYQYAGVPVQIGNGKQTVELHVMSRKAPGQKSLDSGNCYVLFRLDMPNLGELDIHLHIVDKVVGVRFLASDADLVSIDLTEQQELRTALQGVGFHLGILKVEEKQAAEAHARLPLLPPVLTQVHLDIKA